MHTVNESAVILVRQRVLRTIVVCLLCAAQTISEPVLSTKIASWQKKDWKQWSSNDCVEVLENSPWVATEKYYDYWDRMQIRSALPIRLALLRQFLIRNDYDGSRGAKRKALDDRIARDLTENLDDRILVRYEYGVNHSEDSPYLQLIPAGHNGLLLTSDGRVIRSIQTIDVKKHSSWTSESEEFTLVFPRVIDGKHVIKSRAVIFAVTVGSLEGSTFSPDMKFTFRLDNMEYKGKVEY